MQADVHVGDLSVADWPPPYILGSALSPSLLPNGSPLEDCGEPLNFRCVKYYHKENKLSGGYGGLWLLADYTLYQHANHIRRCGEDLRFWHFQGAE